MLSDTNRGLCLFVNTPTQAVVSLRGLKPSTLMRNLKERLELETGIPMELISVFYISKFLTDDVSLSSLSIKNGSVLRLVIRSDDYVQLYKAVSLGDIDALFTNRLQYLKCSLAKNDTERGKIEAWNESASINASIATFMASASGNMELLDTLLRKSAQRKEYRTAGGRTALHAAAYHDNAAVVNLLLGHGFTGSTRDHCDMTPLQIAKFYQCSHAEKRLWLSEISSANSNLPTETLLKPKKELRKCLSDPGWHTESQKLDSKKQVGFPNLGITKPQGEIETKMKHCQEQDISLPRVHHSPKSKRNYKEREVPKDVKLSSTKSIRSGNIFQIRATLSEDEGSHDTALQKLRSPETSLDRKLKDLSKALESCSDTGLYHDHNNVRNILKRHYTKTPPIPVQQISDVINNRTGGESHIDVDFNIDMTEPNRAEEYLGNTNSRLFELTLPMGEMDEHKIVNSKQEPASIKARNDTTETLGQKFKCLQVKNSREKSPVPDIVVQDLDLCELTPNFNEDAKFKVDTNGNHVESTQIQLYNLTPDITSSYSDDCRKVSFEEWLSRKRSEHKLLQRSRSVSNFNEDSSNKKSQPDENSEAFDKWLSKKKLLEKRHSIGVIRSNNDSNSRKMQSGLSFEKWLEKKSKSMSKIDTTMTKIIKPVTHQKQVCGLTHEQWLERKSREPKGSPTNSEEDFFLSQKDGKRTGLSFQEWLHDKDKSIKIDMIRRATLQEAEELQRRMAQYNRLASPRVKTFQEWVLSKRHEQNHQNSSPKSKILRLKNPEEDAKLVYDMWMVNKHFEEMADEEKKTKEMRELWEQKKREQIARASKKEDTYVENSVGAKQV